MYFDDTCYADERIATQGTMPGKQQLVLLKNCLYSFLILLQAVVLPSAVVVSLTCSFENISANPYRLLYLFLADQFKL
jgi:hypothetical protein